MSQCCQTIYPKGQVWPRPRTCRNKVFVERDGKMYCAVHDPEAIKRRNEERESAWRVAKNIRHRERLCVSACSGITTEQLQAVADGKGRLAFESKQP